MPLRRSIGAILKLIVRKHEADAASIYEYLPGNVAFRRCDLSSNRAGGRATDGIPLPPDASTWLDAVDALVLITGSRPESTSVFLQEFERCLLMPVAVQNDRKLFLYVGWLRARPDQDLAVISALGEGLKLILSKCEEQDEARALRAEVTRLQFELADSKIADLTAGMIPASAAGPVSPDVIYQHIARVLQSCEDSAVLANRVEELKDELASRQRIAVAKDILQKRHGITEQEAYLRLQRAGRSARIALGEVAEQVIAAQEQDLGSRRIA